MGSKIPCIPDGLIATVGLRWCSSSPTFSELNPNVTGASTVDVYKLDRMCLAIHSSDPHKEGKSNKGGKGRGQRGDKQGHSEIP